MFNTCNNRNTFFSGQRNILWVFNERAKLSLGAGYAHELNLKHKLKKAKRPFVAKMNGLF